MITNFDDETTTPVEMPQCVALRAAVHESIRRDRVLEAKVLEGFSAIDRKLANLDGKLDVVLQRDAALFARSTRRAVVKGGALAAVVSPLVVHWLETGWPSVVGAVAALVR